MGGEENCSKGYFKLSYQMGKNSRAGHFKFLYRVGEIAGRGAGYFKFAYQATENCSMGHLNFSWQVEVTARGISSSHTKREKIAARAISNSKTKRARIAAWGISNVHTKRGNCSSRYKHMQAQQPMESPLVLVTSGGTHSLIHNLRVNKPSTSKMVGW